MEDKLSEAVGRMCGELTEIDNILTRMHEENMAFFSEMDKCIEKLKANERKRLELLRL